MKKIAIGLVFCASGAAANADVMGTLYVDGLHTDMNAQIVWTPGSVNEGGGSGAFYGRFGGNKLDPFYCTDVLGEIGIPTSFEVTRSLVYNEAGYLVDTYAPSVMNDEVKSSALQFAIWKIYFPGLTATPSAGDAALTSGGMDVADWTALYLADGAGKKGSAYYYDRGTHYGQSQISQAPTPAAALVFAFGVLRRRNRKA